MGADFTRHAADLLGRVAMDQMHRDAKAAAAKLRRAFVQYTPNLVALDLRQSRRRSTLGRRFAPVGRDEGQQVDCRRHGVRQHDPLAQSFA